MKTASELQKELEQKRGEFKSWMDERKTDAGLDFKGQDIETFNQRNDELSAMHDEWMQAKSIEEAARANEAAMKSMKEIDRKVGFGDYDSGAENGNGHQSVSSIKTLGQLFIESPEYKANAEKSPSTAGPWAAEIYAPQFQSAVSEGDAIQGAIKATLTTTTGVVPYPAARPGIVDYATQRPTLRNLMAVDDTNGAQMIQFIRQNTQTFGADIVAEGAAKPETTLGTERVVATLEVVAHHIKVTNQALQFIPGIRDLIDRKGTLGIQLAEETNILSYNGSAGWKGFLIQTGVQTDAVGGSDKFSAFHRGMTLVESVGFATSTGFVIHPNDWHEIVTIKDTTGRFIYGDPSAQSPQPRLWGVPGVSTTKMTEGTVLQGDFRMDSKLWTSGGIRIIVGYVNDDLQKNQQTIVIEEYMLLEIDRPASFVKTSGF